VACDPVGASDIAQRLGVQAATVARWKYRGLLPEAEWQVSGLPCWNWPVIEKWAKGTGRMGLTAEQVARRAARAEYESGLAEAREQQRAAKAKYEQRLADARREGRAH
jgi:acetyl-CoA acetyltransferase